ncbi:MAG: 1-acyl-sn-glycerol-3-phosphate acyltransferase [Bryobacteraceae bacterium]
MSLTVLGRDGPLKREIAALAPSEGPEGVVVCLEPELVDSALAAPGLRRLVLRSTAYAYGSSIKNPGLMTEERISLLPPNAPEQRWLRAEEKALAFSNAAVLRLSNLLAPEEGDVIVREIARASGKALAGHDPNVQFVALRDAARAFVSASNSDATGIFNITGSGVIPLKKVFRAAGVRRVPTFGGVELQAMQHNWTVSGARAARELGFLPEKSSLAALDEFVRTRPGARVGLLRKPYDNYGLDVDYIRAWGAWFWFLRSVYWRIDSEGIENIPENGPGLYVSNHRGFMPLDAVMHLSLVLTQRQRIIRFLIIPSLLKFPFLCNFLTKLGGVIACQENAASLFTDGNLVGIFPEGIRGAFTPYRQWFQLRDFSKSAFARIAIENQVPIVPAAVVGHAEIFPILARIDSSYVTREFGWPYLPIAPLFPLAPIPIPTKWHMRVLPPVPLAGLKPADAENARLVRDFSRHVQNIMQTNIDDMRRKRKSIFWGKVLDGSAPLRPVFERPSPDSA